MTIPEMISVLEAARDGNPIQSASVVNSGEPISTWRDEPNPIWGFDCYAYRVKPEPREWWIVHVGCELIVFPDKAPAQEYVGRFVKLTHEVIHVREVIGEQP